MPGKRKRRIPPPRPQLPDRLPDEVSVGSFTDSDWRACVAGADRSRLQELLLSKAGTLGDRSEAEICACYRAAYAVLPYGGCDRLELARLLVACGPYRVDWLPVDVPIEPEWVHVLVLALLDREALAGTQAASLVGAIRALVVAIEGSPTATDDGEAHGSRIRRDVARVRWVQETLLTHGYRL